MWSTLQHWVAVCLCYRTRNIHDLQHRCMVEEVYHRLGTECAPVVIPYHKKVKNNTDDVPTSTCMRCDSHHVRNICKHWLLRHTIEGTTSQGIA